MRAADVFDDVRAILGPKKETSNVCFCLSYRIGAKENQALHGPERFDRVRGLCAEELPPGVLAYDGAEPVGWAAIHPRADTSFATNRRIPQVDGHVDPWSLWCVRVRPGHRKQGISHELVAGALDFARSRGAAVVEAYPVDNKGAKVDLTMAYVGTRALFERAGFEYVVDTTSTLNGFTRVLMRYVL